MSLLPRERGTWQIVRGDVSEVLRDYPATFAGVLCDPPYGQQLDALAWDHRVPAPEAWQVIREACKPGAPLLAAGAARTFGALTTALEGGGWEIRDMVAWIHAQGKPQGRAVARLDLDGDAAARWDDYHSALRPAVEPWALARAPLCGTLARNVLAHDCGLLNIRDTRPHKRHTPNVVLSEVIASGLDALLGPRTSGAAARCPVKAASAGRTVYQNMTENTYKQRAYGDTGGPSRFFLVSKAKGRERHIGAPDGHNPHPTTKPLELAVLLARLLLPPRGWRTGALVVPYCGSGTEVAGAVLAGWDHVVGVELDAAHADLARSRVPALIEHWQNEQR